MGHRKGRRWKRGEGEGGKGVGEANGGEGKRGEDVLLLSPPLTKF